MIDGDVPKAQTTRLEFSISQGPVGTRPHEDQVSIHHRGVRSFIRMPMEKQQALDKRLRCKKSPAFKCLARLGTAII